MTDNLLHTTLAQWANFYLITGSAAAALTGLQFIVQTLLASNAFQSITGNDPEGGVSAFGTPTVVHFALALLISATMCAPWPSDTSLRVLLGTLGGSALVYSAIVFRRMRRQQSYVTTLYDLCFHVLAPASAYATFVGAALFLRPDHEAMPLSAVAIATLVLICAAIHNSWDTVSYLTITMIQSSRPDSALPPENASRPKSKRQQARGHRRR